MDIFRAVKALDLPFGQYVVYDADDTWEYGAYNPIPEDLIASAEVIDDMPFAPLMDVLKWKEAFGRPKDLADIELIRQHLSMSH